MVIIAYNNQGYPISIVVAISKQLALAFWHGQGLPVHSTSIVEEDFIISDEQISGVIPILKTFEQDVYLLNRDKTVLLVSKK